jgi:hypothetical protein
MHIVNHQKKEKNNEQTYTHTERKKKRERYTHTHTCRHQNEINKIIDNIKFLPIVERDSTEELIQFYPSNIEVVH